MPLETLPLQVAVLAGPAILTNACAIMQNGATARYQLAIPQWREFRASLAAKSEHLATLYADPDSALNLSERRIRLLLRGLNCLYAGVGLFGATTFLGLLTVVFAAIGWPAAPLAPAIIGLGGLGLLAMLAASACFVLESRCAGGLLALQLRLDQVPEIGALHPVAPSRVSWG